MARATRSARPASAPVRRGALRAAALVAAAWLGAAAPARADLPEPFTPGPREGLSLHPFASLTGVYDSNVMLEPGDGTGEFGLWFAPGIEARYRNGDFRAGAEVGADIRRYFGSLPISDYFWRVAGFAELAVTPALTLRLADAYAPQPLNLGLPEDDAENLVQSNRLEGEARYRRQLPRAYVVDLALRGTRFDTDAYEARRDSRFADLPRDEDPYVASYSDVTSQIELQRGFDRRTIGYARVVARDRFYDDLGESCFYEVSGLVGARFRGPARTQIELAGGYGLVNYRSGPTKPTALGLLELRGDMDGGWRWHTGVSRNFTSDVSTFGYAETVGRAGLEKRLGSRTRASVEVMGGQFNSEAPDVGNQTYWAVETALRRQLTRSVQAGLVFRHWRTNGESSLHDVTQNRVTLELSYRR